MSTDTTRITLTPYICVKGGTEAIAFYEKAFGATEVQRIMDGGRVSHAEIDRRGAHLPGGRASGDRRAKPAVT